MGGSPSPVAPDLLSWARVLEDASCQPEELLHSCCSLLLLVFLCGSSYTSQMGTDALSTGDVTLVCFLLRWPAYVWEAFLFYFLFLWAGQEVWMNLKLSQSVPCPQLSILLFNECIFCPYHYLLTHLFSLKSLNAIRRWTLFSLPLPPRCWDSEYDPPVVCYVGLESQCGALCTQGKHSPTELCLQAIVDVLWMSLHHRTPPRT